ncbi:hypothetical protein LJB42_004243 [Komagataella kurtzmanii]|nr:hypothetical protein LJB42_004243 [Komagataella kurtzmanii]
MDLRQLTETPSFLDQQQMGMQRRPSISSMSSAASGYASSVNNTNNNPLRVNAGQPRYNAWLSPQNGNPMVNVDPWIEQQVNVSQYSPPNDGKFHLEEDAKDDLLKESDALSQQQKPLDSELDGIGDTNDDEDVIPTAIVIKNIPFAIKKEQLLDVMTKFSLPLPYAFNYHFDNGVFRGLAFANFTSTDEACLVVENLNGKEIGGRKLRVEYKKMLPLPERERIEREKREKRGQLEEQHRSMSSASLASLYSVASAPPNVSKNVLSQQNAPDRLYATIPSQLTPIPSGLDMNDPETLELYTQLLLFREDKDQRHSELAIPTTANSSLRRVLPLLSQFLGLADTFEGGFIIIRRQSFQHPLQQSGISASSTAASISAANSNLIRSQSYGILSSAAGSTNISSTHGRYRQPPQSATTGMYTGQQYPPSQQQSPRMGNSGLAPLGGTAPAFQQAQSTGGSSMLHPALSSSNLGALNAAVLRGSSRVVKPSLPPGSLQQRQATGSGQPLASPANELRYSPFQSFAQPGYLSQQQVQQQQQQQQQQQSLNPQVQQHNSLFDLNSEFNNMGL